MLDASYKINYVLEYFKMFRRENSTKNYLSFFLPFPDFLPPEELFAPLSPFPLGLVLTDLYLLFVDEKTDLFFFFSLFLETE